MNCVCVHRVIVMQQTTAVIWIHYLIYRSSERKNKAQIFPVYCDVRQNIWGWIKRTFGYNSGRQQLQWSQWSHTPSWHPTSVLIERFPYWQTFLSFSLSPCSRTSWHTWSIMVSLSCRPSWNPQLIGSISSSSTEPRYGWTDSEHSFSAGSDTLTEDRKKMLNVTTDLNRQGPSHFLVLALTSQRHLSCPWRSGAVTINTIICLFL